MGREEVYTELWWGYLRKRDHLGDPGADWKILKCIFISGMGKQDWIDLA